MGRDDQYIGLKQKRSGQVRPISIKVKNMRNKVCFESMALSLNTIFRLNLNFLNKQYEQQKYKQLHRPEDCNMSVTRGE